jgi:hypothetical protein
MGEAGGADVRRSRDGRGGRRRCEEEAEMGEAGGGKETMRGRVSARRLLSTLGLRWTVQIY